MKQRKIKEDEERQVKYFRRFLYAHKQKRNTSCKNNGAKVWGKNFRRET